MAKEPSLLHDWKRELTRAIGVNDCSIEDMRLPAAAREALLDDPDFLRELVEAALNRFLDAEITEHLQARPYERSQALPGYRKGIGRGSSKRAWAR